MDVVGCVWPCELILMEPPQPMTRLAPTAASATRTCKPRRFFQPNQQSATASTEPGNNGTEFGWRVAWVSEVVIVSVDDAAVPEGITFAGENMHDAPAGNPEQLNCTGESNEFSGMTETVAVPLCPVVTASEPGVTATMKLGVGRLIVYAAEFTPLGE
jgi:hypothetical protein